MQYTLFQSELFLYSIVPHSTQDESTEQSTARPPLKQQRLRVLTELLKAAMLVLRWIL